MRRIIAIARHTFREAVRDRVLHGAAAGAFLFILLDFFFAKLALGDLVMIKSFGLAGLYLFGLIITIFMGASAIHAEIERRTLYFILSKPVSRAEFLLGKFFGLLAALFLAAGLIAVAYLAVIAFEGGGLDRLGLLAIVFQLLEMALLTALLIFLSAIVRPLTAAVCSILLAFAGHLLPAAFRNAAAAGPAARRTLSFLYYVLPNLEKFDLRGFAAHSLSLPPEALFSVFLYAFAYTAFLLMLAIECFKRREL